MFKIFTLTLFSISSLLFSKEDKHDLAVCAIFHNEARFLDEWIEHYLQEGVEKIYLYNNKSDDEYLVVLHKYINAGTVTLIEWPYDNEPLTTWNSTQCSAYRHCINKVNKNTKWLIFVDTDEFMFSPTGKLLKDVVKDYEDCDQVGACWVFYGTSNVQRLPNGAHLKDHMIYRQKEVNITVKSIVKPKKVIDCINPHFFIMKEGSRTVNENKEPMSGAFTTPSANILRVNHYWARDLDFFYNEKLRRRKSWVNGEIQSFIDAEKSMNEVYDPILSD